MDDQSLSRVRVWLQVLLCAVHARVHGAGWVRIREKDLCEEGCGATIGLGCSAQIFIRVRGVWRSATRPHCDWYGDGPLPARRTRIWRDAGVPGGIGETRGDEHFDHHEIESDRARHRRAATYLRALGPGDRYHGDDDAVEASAAAGAAGAATEPATRGGEAVARGGAFGGSVGVAADPRDHGSRWGSGSSGRGCEGSRSSMVFFGSAVPDAVLGKAVLAVCAGEISAAGK